MNAKKVSESRITFVHRPLPATANTAGKMFGGDIMRLMDEVGAICALRHARSPLVTGSIEQMDFLAPIWPGDIMFCHASVNLVSQMAMEVGIRIEAEDCMSGERRQAGRCYMTFVGVDEAGKARLLPPVEAETDEEVRRMGDAARRLALSRLARKQAGGKALYLDLRLLPGRYAICLLPVDAEVPDLPPNALLSVSRTPSGITLVVEQSRVGQVRGLCAPHSVDDAYVCMQVTSSCGMRMVGRFAALTTILAAAEVPIFAMSAYNSDYFLVHTSHLEKTVDVLRAAGHTVSQPSIFQA